MRREPDTLEAAAGRQALAECVRRVKAGAAGAWEGVDACIREHVLSRIPIPAGVDAEDVATDTISTLWRVLTRLKDDEKALCYVAVVARRLVRKKLRDAQRFDRLREEPSFQDPRGEARNLERDELLGRLAGAVRGAESKLFRLLYVCGASSSDLRADLGIRAGILRQRKHRLNQKLRQATISQSPDSPA